MSAFQRLAYFTTFPESRAAERQVVKQEVQVGQVYRDKDKRMTGRYLRVVEFTVLGKARCVSCDPAGNAFLCPTAYTTIGSPTLQTRFELIK